MSLSNTKIIDAIGIEIGTGRAILTIADDWDWIDEHNHLVALQAKINSYFEFVESGQILDEYPDARGRQLVIDIIGRFPLPETAITFLKKAETVASEIEIIITQRWIP